jgi:hypothetical protein
MMLALLRDVEVPKQAIGLRGDCRKNDYKTRNPNYG